MNKLINKFSSEVAIKTEIIDELFMYSEKGNFSIMYNDKVYRVGSVLYYLIEQLKLVDLESALSKVRIKYNLDAVEGDEVLVNLDKFINHLNDNVNVSRNAYINLSITIFNERITNKISNLITFLFTKVNFILTSILCICINLFYYVNIGKEKIDVAPMTVSVLVISYGILLLIMVAHEFGHAAASKYFGIDPKEIGLGIYFIFPVLYSNVTRIWVLPKHKRLIVNLAGVYIQFIFNAILVVFYYTIDDTSVSNSIYFITKINVFVALYSLQPFIRNDGYWLYSDFFELPNLNKKSILFPSILLRGIVNKHIREKILSKDNFWLSLYSTGNFIFITSITITFITFAYNSTKYLFSLPYIFSNDILTNKIDYFMPTFNFLFSITLAILMSKNILHWIKLTQKELS